MKNLLTTPLIKTTFPQALTFLILLIALVGFFAMDIYFPSLPAISVAYNSSPSTAQLTLTLFLIGYGVSQLIYGPLSDYYGRRPVLLIGFSIYLISSILLISSHTILTLLIARFIQGAGAGAGASLCRVLLRDKFVGHKMSQAASYITIGIGIVTATAPALGGFIQEAFNFRGNFIFMLLFGVMAFLFVLIYLPETNETVKNNSLRPSIILSNYTRLLKNKIFVGNMLCSGLAFSGLIAYAIINPFLLQNKMHLSPMVYGVITLVIASGELIGTYINSIFVSKIGCIKMIYIGILLILSAAFFSLYMSHHHIFNVSTIVIASFIATLSIGITIPNATAEAFSTIKDSIGTAGSIYGFFQVLITVLTTLLIVNIKNQAQQSLGYIFLGIGILSFVTYILLSKR